MSTNCVRLRSSLMFVLVMAMVFPILGSEPKQDVDLHMSDVNRLVENRNKLGQSLLSILKNERNTVALRLQAADALCKLPYTPAIDELIKLIDTKTKTLTVSEASMTTIYPILGCLAIYGPAALPNLIQAYFNDSKEHRRTLMLFAMRTGSPESIVDAYAKGYASTKTDHEAEKRLQTLLDFKRK